MAYKSSYAFWQLRVGENSWKSLILNTAKIVNWWSSNFDKYSYETFFGDLHHSVWRSKDLLACNATYSIATKGQNAVFFLHLIYGLDYYARARHIFHSSISFSSLLNSATFVLCMCTECIHSPLTNSNIVETLEFGKKYIFRHEFRVFFAVYLTLSSLYTDQKSGKTFSVLWLTF